MKRLPIICMAILIALPGLNSSRVDRLPGEKENWIQVDTEHFSLITNTSKRRALQFGRDLETLRDVLESTSGLKLYSPLETRVFVFKNTDSMNQYNLGPDGKPRTWAGYFRSTPDGNYVAVDASASENPNRIIYHEYLHYVMRNSIPMLPLWLNEGMAEFYSSFHVAGGKAYIGRAVRHHLVWLNRNPMIPLDELLAVDSDDPIYNESEQKGTFYAQSWALAHYLVAGSVELNSRMKDLLALIKQGVDSKTALQRAYGVDLATLEKQLKDYVRQDSFGFYAHTPEEPFDEQKADAVPLERKHLLVRLGDLLVHQPKIPFSSAYAHVNAALALDENLAEAYVVLARLKFEEDKYNEAFKYCEKAASMTTGDPRIYAIHGMGLLDSFFDSTSPTDELPATVPPVVLQAREKFRKSLELAPDHIPGLVGLGATYHLDTGDLTEGVHAWARASQILPASSEFLANLIMITARSGNLEGARSLLERGLRPRGEAEPIRLAENGLAVAAAGRAHEMYRAGNIEDAMQLLRQTIADTGDPEVKGQVSATLRDLEDHAAEKQVVDLHNQALEEANAGNLEQAAALMEQVVEQAEDPMRREEARAKAEMFREAARQRALIERYRRALGLHRGGDSAGAAALLQEILESNPDERLLEASEELLQEIDRFRVEEPSL